MTRSAVSFPPDRELIRSRVRLPQHVVYRTFVNETVVLNLKTGKYHGLNRTAGRMLEVLEHVSSVVEAAKQLASEYERPTEEIEVDLLAFCRDMQQRGLLEVTCREP